MGYFGWWDFEPDQLWRSAPESIAPLTRRENEMLKDGFYPASLYMRESPPDGLPATDPWIRRGSETPLDRKAISE